MSFFSLTIIASVVIAFTLLLFGVYFYVKRQVGALPFNQPETRNLSEKARKKVICVGDSITQGTRSFDYVRHLSDKNSGVTFINAGYSNDLAWNVLQRLDPVISLQPDFITLLIGSFEVDAILTKKNNKRYVKTNGLPQPPSPDWFKENLELILQKLLVETTAKLALISPPLVGEDLNEDSNYWTAEYSAIIKTVAHEYGVAYLPLNERERELLHSLNHSSRCSYKKGRRLYRKAAFNRYVLGKSWDNISKKNGFLLTPDLLHKNSKGGKIIVHLIEKFVSRVDDKQENVEAKVLG
ncbi:MAG: GDSL-type esterase/lipase family protein [Balneolales bacterium]